MTRRLADAASRLRKSFYSPAEVATLTGESRSTILEYIHAGMLAAVRFSANRYRIPRKSVALLIGTAAPPGIVEEPDADITV